MGNSKEEDKDGLSATSHFWVAISLAHQNRKSWGYWRVLFGDLYGTVAEFMRDTGERHSHVDFLAYLEQQFAPGVSSDSDSSIDDSVNNEHPTLEFQFPSFIKVVTQVLELKQESEPEEIAAGVWNTGSFIEYQYVRRPVVLDISMSYRYAVSQCSEIFTHHLPVVLSASYPSASSDKSSEAIYKLWLSIHMYLLDTGMCPSNCPPSVAEAQPTGPLLRQIKAEDCASQNPAIINSALLFISGIEVPENVEGDDERAGNEDVPIVAVDDAIQVNLIEKRLVRGKALKALIAEASRKKFTEGPRATPLEVFEFLHTVFDFDSSTENVFKLLPGGAAWLVRYANGRFMLIADSMGMSYIAFILSNKGKLLRPDNLQDAVRGKRIAEEAVVLSEFEKEELRDAVLSASSPKLDPDAINDYGRKLASITKKLKKQGLTKEKKAELLKTREVLRKELKEGGGRVGGYEKTENDKKVGAIRNALVRAYNEIAFAELVARNKNIQAGRRFSDEEKENAIKKFYLAYKVKSGKEKEQPEQTEQPKRGMKGSVIIRYVASVMPLAHHLSHCIETGGEYYYRPVTDIKWSL
jgi:hypothetical protein